MEHRRNGFRPINANDVDVETVVLSRLLESAPADDALALA